MIDADSLRELQVIIREDYGTEVDIDQVEKLGEKLVSLYEVLLQPEGKEVT
jgi:hypothetical protein